jgi:hypothetical protein
MQVPNVIELELHRVAPDTFIDDARELPDRVIVCQFENPPRPEDVQRWVAALSSKPIAPDDVQVRAVRYEPAITDSTALSLDALTLHTDGAFLPEPPSRFILSCSMADEGGAGASMLVPVSHITQVAPGWVIDALSTASYRFLMTYDGDLSTSFVGPVLSPGADGCPFIRWRADHIYRPEVVEDRGTRAAEAAAWLHHFLDSCDPFSFVLQTAELLVIPNGLVLHGRRALSSRSHRELLRAWIH